MYLYENSIVEDLNRLFKNSNVTTVISDSLDNALKHSTAKGQDKASLPFIVLAGGDWELADTNFYNVMHGSEYRRITAVDDKEIAKAASVINFTPKYEMYIVATSRRECDMLTREIIFHYYQQPTLTVKVPYKLDLIHTFNINFDRYVRKTQNFNGLVYRTLNITLDGAYLWHNNSMNVIKDVDVTVEERIQE